jgi:hypothetical protein
LQKIPGEGTLQLLEEAQRSKSPESRELIKNAILMVSRRKNAPATQQEED